MAHDNEGLMVLHGRTRVALPSPIVDHEDLLAKCAGEPRMGRNSSPTYGRDIDFGDVEDKFLPPTTGPESPAPALRGWRRESTARVGDMR